LVGPKAGRKEKKGKPIMKTLICLALLAATILEADQAPKGYVVVYRLKRFQGSALEPPVSCDGQLAAKMGNGRFFTLALPPGPHQLTTNNKGQMLEVVSHPNQVQYVQVIIETGLAKGHGKLLLIGADQGSQEATLVKPVDPGKITDASLVLTEIPAPDVLARAARAASSAPQHPEPPVTKVVEEPAAVGSQQPPLDTDTILQMKKSGISDDLIVSMARKHGLAALGPEAIIKMKTAGLSEQSLSQLVQLSSR
jgi:hypothetical protein